MSAKKTTPKAKKKPIRFKFSPDTYSILLFVILLFVIFSGVIFSGGTFLKPDSMASKLTSSGMESLAEKYDIYPLWNPFIFSGMPAFESMTFNKYVYFPSFVFSLITLLGFSGEVVMVLHYLLAGLGGYFLLRHFRLDVFPSFLGGFAFMFTPYLITMLTFGHGSQMMTAVYLPLVFYFAIRLFEKPAIKWGLWLAIVLGFQMQRAHIQIVYYAYMLLGAFFLYRLILCQIKEKNWRQFGLSTGYFFLAIILAFGLAAVLYLPVAEYTQYSIRGARTGGGTGFDYATAWSFHPKEMMTFLVPSWFGFGGQTYWGHMPFTDYPNYMGIIVLIFAIVALFTNKKPIVYFLGIIACLGLLISFGKYFFFYGILYKYLPYFNKFRVPSMMLIMVQFSVALLAAFGLEGAIKYISKAQKDESGYQLVTRIIYVIWVILGIVILYITLMESSFRSVMTEKFSQHLRSAQYAQRLAGMRFDMLYKDLWIIILIIGTASVAAYFFLKNKLSGKGFSYLVIGLTVVDLFLVDFKLADSNPRKNLDRFLQPDGVAKALTADDTVFRIFPLGNLMNEKRWSARMIESIGGYHPAKLGLYQKFMENTKFQSGGILRMLNVKYIISTRKFRDSRFEEVTETYATLLQGNIPVVIYRFKEFLPRAFFADKISVQPNREAIYSELVKADYDPVKTAFLLDPSLNSLDLDSTAEVRDIRWSPHRIEIDYSSQKDAYLVLSEVYYPVGWKAFIGSEELPIRETNALLRGVVVPAGEKTITFIYEQPYVKKGFWITLISSLVTLSGMIFIYRRNLLKLFQSVTGK